MGSRLLPAHISNSEVRRDLRVKDGAGLNSRSPAERARGNGLAPDSSIDSDPRQRTPGRCFHHRNREPLNAGVFA
jgi:hypothetical protein